MSYRYGLSVAGWKFYKFLLRNQPETRPRMTIEQIKEKAKKFGIEDADAYIDDLTDVGLAKYDIGRIRTRKGFVWATTLYPIDVTND